MGARDQAGVIAFRRKRDGIEICLIRNKGQKQWKIPKGFIDPGETPQEAALKEAWEEAGLRGRIVGDSVGSYEYEKWGLDLIVAMYLMEVNGEEDEWEESRFREREWTSVANAVAMLKRHPVQAVLESATAKLERRKRPR